MSKIFPLLHCTSPPCPARWGFSLAPALVLPKRTQQENLLSPRICCAIQAMCSKNPVAAIHPPTLPSSWWTSKVAVGKFFLVSDMRVKMSQLQLLCHRETWDTSTRGSCSPLQMKAYTRWQQLQQISQPLWSGKSIGGQKTVSQKSNFGNSYCTKFILGPGTNRN